VRTDVLDLTLSTQGGEFQTADLLKYPLVKNNPDVPVRLFNSQPGDGLFLARSGLRAADGRSEPTHLAIFQAAATEYRLEDGQDEVTVPLTWTDGQGLTVTKSYTFRRGSYAVPIRYEVVNQSPTDWKAASYLQLVRHYVPVSRSMFDVESYAYRGPAVYNGKAYRKLSVEDEEDRVYQASFAGGWMAAMQHHFVAAAVPPVGSSYDYQLAVDANNDFVMSYRGPLQTVAAGATGRFEETLFVGPKLQDQLAVDGARTAAHGGLRQAHDHLAAAVLAAREGLRVRRQLGLVDHPDHVPHQARVLQAVPRRAAVPWRRCGASVRASRPCRNASRTIASSSAGR
jgi:YidC/Oxa1 family membrane protein insertase